MRSIRKEIGGLGNLMFKQAYLWSQLRDGLIPDLYLQSEKYFAKYKEEIKQLFGFGIGNKTINKVAIHVRRGDYLKAIQFHVPLWQTDYYKKAIEMFPNERFLVFCKDNQDPVLDEADKEWCKEYLSFLGDRVEFREHQSETEDLNAMASCKSLIGANSSFSWWASFLGQHEKAVFPALDKWFTDGKRRIDGLSTWTEIDFS